MATFRSSEKTIDASRSVVYQRLSNPESFQELAAANIPDDLKAKVGKFRIDGSVITLSANPIGDISFEIAKKVENEKIRLETVASPLPFSIEVHLSDAPDLRTVALAEIKIELNPIIKPMVSKPLQDAVEKFAGLLVMIPYNK